MIHVQIHRFWHDFDHVDPMCLSTYFSCRCPSPQSLDVWQWHGSARLFWSRGDRFPLCHCHSSGNCWTSSDGNLLGPLSRWKKWWNLCPKSISCDSSKSRLLSRLRYLYVFIRVYCTAKVFLNVSVCVGGCLWQVAPGYCIIFSAVLAFELLANLSIYMNLHEFTTFDFWHI